MISRSKVAKLAKSSGFKQVSDLLRSDSPGGDDLWRTILSIVDPRQPPGLLKGPFSVLLGHMEDEGNIPTHLRPGRHLPGIGGQEIKTPREAGEVFRLFVQGTGSGAASMHPMAGLVVDKDNVVVARVSYNGRVWRVPAGLQLRFIF